MPQAMHVRENERSLAERREHEPEIQLHFLRDRWELLVVFNENQGTRQEPGMWNCIKPSSVSTRSIFLLHR